MKKRARGEGSIFRRANGVWVALTPSPERKAFTSRTSQTEAKRRRDEYLATHGNIAHASARQNVVAYLRLWLSTKKVRARTFDGYLNTIERHIAPTLEKYRLCDLEPQHVQAMLSSIESPWSRWQAYGRLKEALELAVTWDVIRRNPVAKVAAVPKPQSNVTPIAESHFYALLDAIDKDRLRALWYVLLTVGPRRGEAIAVARSMVGDARTLTFVRSLQRVRGKLVFVPAKSANSNRTATLAAEVRAAILDQLAAQDRDREAAGETWQENDLLFCTRIGTPLEPRNVSRRWHQLLKKAKVPAIKLHAARHTVASMLLHDGADIYAVQALLGHASPSITVSVYGHLMTAPTVTADKMSAALKRRPKV